MARKGKYGKYIFSANEVGEYVVCPEAWKLKVVDRVNLQTSERSERGRELHSDWAASYDESLYLARSARLIVFLLLLAITIFLLLR